MFDTDNPFQLTPTHLPVTVPSVHYQTPVHGYSILYLHAYVASTLSYDYTMSCFHNANLYFPFPHHYFW